MTAFTKRVVFTMGGKGGVGKTGAWISEAFLRWLRDQSRCAHAGGS